MSTKPNEDHASMNRPAVCSEALLTSMPEEEWTEAFDQVLRDVLEQCKPGYMQVPTDVWGVKVSRKGLETKLVRNTLLRSNESDPV